MNPSDEQNEIIRAVRLRQNVVVNAVAGSGKTTTIMFMAQAMPQYRFLQLTYNRQLKQEVRKKITDARLDNVEVHTYHSLAVKFYRSDAFTDDRLARLIRTNAVPRTSWSHNETILVIDEVQDMLSRYMKMVVKFLRDNNLMHIQIVLMGDDKQGIYAYRGSSERFLTLADHIWERPFVHLQLNQSYRIPLVIANYINKLTGSTIIASSSEFVGSHGIIEMKSISEGIKAVKKHIRRFLGLGFEYNDIFILFPSIRNYVAEEFEREFSSAGIPIMFAPDSAGIDEEIMANKIVFSSFHQSKGRERPIVFLSGFDMSYYQFTARNEDPSVCTPAMYVAMTRASKHLILMRQLKFGELNFTSNQGDCNVQESRNNDPPTSVKATIDGLSDTFIDELTDDIDNAFVLVQQLPPIKLPTKTVNRFGDRYLYEDVSMINGVFIPQYFYRLRSCPEYTPLCSVALQDLVFDMARDGGFSHKAKQITNFDWLDPHINVCIKHLGLVIPSDLKVLEETPVMTRTDGKTSITNIKELDKPSITMSGRIDFESPGKRLWEIKCAKETTIKHKIQVMLYCWMRNWDVEADLFNVVTGEHFQCVVGSSVGIVERIIQATTNVQPLSDGEFIETNRIRGGNY